jgi:hypothetical protein
VGDGHDGAGSRLLNLPVKSGASHRTVRFRCSSGPSFETPLAAAPQDEGDGSESGMAGTDPWIKSGKAMPGEQDKGEYDEGGRRTGRGYQSRKARPSFCPVPGFLLGSAKKSDSKTDRFALEPSLRIGAEIVDERT